MRGNAVLKVINDFEFTFECNINDINEKLLEEDDIMEKQIHENFEIFDPSNLEEEINSSKKAIKVLGVICWILSLIFLNLIIEPYPKFKSDAIIIPSLYFNPITDVPT